MTIGTCQTLIGLINALIGGSMLAIPIVALSSGYIEWTIGSTVLACVSAYTAYLLILHLGKAKNIKYLILYHFKGDHTYPTVYSIVIFFSFLSSMVVYFNLFCIQITGLIDNLQHIPELIFIFLVFWVILLREIDISEFALACGIFAVIGYIFFITQMIVTEPNGPNVLQPTNFNTSGLILTLLNAFAIHDLMIQVIIVNPTRKDYPKIIFLLFLIANVLFIFICFGSQGIMNRKSNAKNIQTIVDFMQGEDKDLWSLSLLQILYIFHILSAFPEYVIVSKIRIFQIFEIEHNPSQNISFGEILFIIFIIGICYCVKKSEVSLGLLLSISGAIFGYIFVIFFPIFLHLKCLHYDRSSGFIDADHPRNLQIHSNPCQCNVAYRSSITLWLQTFFLIFIDIFSAIYFFWALRNQFLKSIQKN